MRGSGPGLTRTTFILARVTSKTRDDELHDWLTVVDREARRHAIIDRSLRAQNSGLLTMPIRFVFKIAEIGPVAATRLATGVILGRLRAR